MVAINQNSYLYLSIDFCLNHETLICCRKKTYWRNLYQTKTFSDAWCQTHKSTVWICRNLPPQNITIHPATWIYPWRSSQYSRRLLGWLFWLYRSGKPIRFMHNNWNEDKFSSTSKHWRQKCWTIIESNKTDDGDNSRDLHRRWQIMRIHAADVEEKYKGNIDSESNLNVLSVYFKNGWIYKRVEQARQVQRGNSPASNWNTL